MKSKNRNSRGLTTRIIWAVFMFCVCLLVSSTGIFAEDPEIPSIGHLKAGNPDPGVTTPGPNGTTMTTYGDGWTKTVEPDNSTGKLERKETVKDPNGKIHEIFRRDIKTGEQTYHFIIVDDAGGGKTTYTDIGRVQTKTVEKPNGDKKSYTWKRDPKTKKNDWVEDESDTVSLDGEWQWTCCSGKYSGKWHIDQKPDSTFTGRFLETGPNDIGTFEGRLDGGQVQFIRRFTVGEKSYHQTWRSIRLEMDGGTLKMKGTWNEAFDKIHTLEFSAEKMPGIFAQDDTNLVSTGEPTVIASTDDKWGGVLVDAACIPPTWLVPEKLLPAKWIWAQPCAAADDEAHTFSTAFNVTGKDAKVELDIAVDNFAFVSINGQKAGRVEDFRFATTLDISNYVHQGDNRISIEVHNLSIQVPTGWSNPAGLLARLRETKTKPSQTDQLSSTMESGTEAQRDLFNNFNIGVITNGPLFQPTFTLDRAASITELVTYHSNNGRGATPGTIRLRDQNNNYYNFQARAESGQGAAPNVKWVATVNRSFSAGTYIIDDSDHNTWLRNAQSSYRGFVIVRGQDVQGPNPPAPAPEPNSPPAAAPNPNPSSPLPRLCANSTFAVATISPCTGPIGTTITVNLQRKLTSPPMLLVFRRALVNGVPAQVTIPIVVGSNFTAISSPQLCPIIAGSPKGSGPWEVSLIDALGKSQGVIGSFWPDCR